MSAMLLCRTALWCALSVGACAASLQAQGRIMWSASLAPLMPAEAAAVLAPRAVNPAALVWLELPLPVPSATTARWSPGDGPFGPFPRPAPPQPARWVPIGPWWTGPYALVGPSGVVGWSYQVPRAAGRARF